MLWLWRVRLTVLALVLGCSTVPSNLCGDLVENPTLGSCECPAGTTRDETDPWACLLPDGGTIRDPNAPDSSMDGGNGTDVGMSCGGGCGEGFGCCEDRCVRLDTSDNCGSCGIRCEAELNEAAACDRGTCVIACQAGFENCDDAVPGCETDLLAPSSCGSCENACSTAPNSVSLCDPPSSCTSVCLDDFADCNDDPLDGCEVQISSSTSNCGECSRECDTTVADSCRTGMCSCGDSAACGDDALCISSDCCGSVSQISSGSSHACAVGSSGRLWCWGTNGTGALGTGLLDDRAAPALVGTIDDWAVVDAGGALTLDAHTCAVRTNGWLYCWGGNSVGQLGLGSGDSRVTAPTRVGVERDWSAVAVGSRFTCGVRRNGTLWCWGTNDSGQLGRTGSGSRVPVQVGTGTNWVDLDAGGLHACARRSDDSLWCWGDNFFSQLGLGDSDPRTAPTRVGTSTWIQVSTGTVHTCARRPDDTTWCWGTNDSGQLGTGPTSPRTTPTRVIGLTYRFAAVSAGNQHTCATTSEGRAYCWGWNEDGQLGRGRPGDTNSPVPVDTSGTWLSVSAGGQTCGIQSDGSPWCWGLGAVGFETMIPQYVATRTGCLR